MRSLASSRRAPAETDDSLAIAILRAHDLDEVDLSTARRILGAGDLLCRPIIQCLKSRIAGRHRLTRLVKRAVCGAEASVAYTGYRQPAVDLEALSVRLRPLERVPVLAVGFCELSLFEE